MTPITKDVIISVESVHDYGAEEEDSIDFMTDGVYSYDGQTARLSYQESEVTGLEGTRTSVEVTPERVVVDRDGSITSRMIFREGARDSFLYDTPMGSATLHMKTRGLSALFNEHGGHVEIDYVLDLEHAYISRNRFNLTVREQYKGDRSNG